MMNELKGKEILDVIDRKSDTFKVIKFTADWCMPCQALKEALNKAALWEKFPNVEWYEVDISDEVNRPVCSELEINSVPLMVVLKGDLILDFWTGYSKEVIKDLVFIFAERCPTCGQMKEEGKICLRQTRP